MRPRLGKRAGPWISRDGDAVIPPPGGGTAHLLGGVGDRAGGRFGRGQLAGESGGRTGGFGGDPVGLGVERLPIAVGRFQGLPHPPLRGRQGAKLAEGLDGRGAVRNAVSGRPLSQLGGGRELPDRRLDAGPGLGIEGVVGRRHAVMDVVQDGLGGQQLVLGGQGIAGSRFHGPAGPLHLADALFEGGHGRPHGPRIAGDRDLIFAHPPP